MRNLVKMREIASETPLPSFEAHRDSRLGLGKEVPHVE